MVGSANLPLPGLALDIDYSGTLTINRAEGNVLFRGAAFEMYFKANDGSSCDDDAVLAREFDEATIPGSSEIGGKDK